jgi:hypothetical protein
MVYFALTPDFILVKGILPIQIERAFDLVLREMRNRRSQKY